MSPGAIFESGPDGNFIYDRGYSGNGTYRTLCVRTCDGYYFPISFSTTSEYFPADARSCEALCPGTEARLFYYPNPGGGPENMTSITGEHVHVAANGVPIPHQHQFRLHLPAARRILDDRRRTAGCSSLSSTIRRRRRRARAPRRGKIRRPSPTAPAFYVPGAVNEEVRRLSADGRRPRRPPDPHRGASLLGQQGTGRRGDRARSELMMYGRHPAAWTYSPPSSEDDILALATGSTMKLVHSLQWTGRGDRSFEVQGAEHGVELSIIVEDMPPGGGPRLHRHPYGEAWVVVSGKAEFSDGTSTMIAGTGDVMFVGRETRTSSAASAKSR